MTLLHTQIDRRAQTLLLLDKLINAAPTEANSAVTPITLDANSRDLDYILALTTGLTWLGAVELNEETLTIRVTSPQAGYALRLLRDLVSAGKPLVADWNREGVTPSDQLRHPFGAAVDLLAALDRRRHEVLPRATPVRSILAAVGVIARLEADGSRAYLLVYDPEARTWQLPGGRFEDRDQSLRDTLLRELSEELRCGVLREPDDLTLHELGSPLVEVRESPTYGLRSETLFHVFLVQITHTFFTLHEDLRWVRETDIVSGVTVDGKNVSTVPLTRLLQQSNIDSSDLISVKR